MTFLLSTLRQFAGCLVGSHINVGQIWENRHCPFSLVTPPSEWCRHSFLAWCHCFLILIFFSLLPEGGFFCFFFFFANLDKYLNTFSSILVRPSVLPEPFKSQIGVPGVVFHHIHMCVYFYNGPISACYLLVSLVLVWR